MANQNQKKEEKQYKTKKDEMKDGTMIAFYGEKAFCKVKQALGIDRVHFAFVEKGTKGSGIDVYVDADDFDNLCDDILSGAFKHEIANDKGSYPSAWEIKTGENATKKVAIGKSTRYAAAIHGYDASQKKNIMIGILSYNELKNMAKWWRRVSVNYYDELASVCRNASVGHVSPEDLTVPTPSVKEENVQNNFPRETLTIVATAALKERQSFPGDYAMTGKADDKPVNIVIKATEIKKMGTQWDKLLERSTDRTTPLQFTAVFERTTEGKNTVYVFKEFQK